ncbi:MAG: LytR/AlgR family response regulator transcription factor [Gammaproteobacteria bacterium]
MNEPLHALIVDDEPPARRVLTRLLAEIPGIEVAGTAVNGMEALTALANGDIDVLFLDIEMPVLAGMELATRLHPTPTPAVIFVTAWPQYAVAAFDVDAADYLLKPVDPLRLQHAIERARSRLTMHDNAQHILLLEASLQTLRMRRLTSAPSYIWVESGRGRQRLTLDDVEWFAADGDYVQAHTATRSYLMNGSLNQLERALPAERLLRIHRSTLINVDAVTRVDSDNGQLLLTTRSGAILQVGRRARTRVRHRLG